MYGRPSRAIAMSEYTLMSKAVWKPDREMSVKWPSRSSRSANATAWTRMSRSPSLRCQCSKTLPISSSSRTSQPSTKVEPIEAASGRTRRLISEAIELKPTSAPWSYRALAMPQAIEWSLATPKTSAFLPLSSPSRTQSSAGRARRRERGRATEVGASTAAACDLAVDEPDSGAVSEAAASVSTAVSCSAGIADRLVGIMSCVVLRWIRARFPSGCGPGGPQAPRPVRTARRGPCQLPLTPPDADRYSRAECGPAGA